MGGYYYYYYYWVDKASERTVDKASECMIFYYNGGVMRDGCIVVGEEVWMRYTILKVGVDKEEVSSVA